MNTDAELARPIALEVTVPRIVLPLSPAALAAKDISGGLVEEAERVTLLLFSPQRRGYASHITPVANTTLEVTTHATIKEIFRLFCLKFVAIPGQLYLLRVHHVQKRQEAGTPQMGTQAYAPLIDDLACMIAFRSAVEHTSEERARSTLTPGRHNVLIMLDENDIPASYYIDGAEG